MVSQTIWIAIVMGVFFVGIGASYAHFANTYDPMSMKFQNQGLFDQMMSNNPKMSQQWMDSGMMNSQQRMNDPQMMNQWMSTMMNDPQAMQQMHDMMMSNPQHMNQMMGPMMDIMMNDPDMQQQMMNMMMNNRDMMDNNMMMNSGMMERGNLAMGFDQTKIMHFFEETTTGGEIGIIALDKRDTKIISEIRSHVEDIQYEFSQGNFSKPFFIHTQVVPGTEIMNEKKDLIQYSTRQIEGGEILVLTTNDPKVLDAIKQFLDFQSSQHMGH